jgi:hypothetical protein
MYEYLRLLTANFFVSPIQDSHKMFVRGNMTLVCQMRRTKGPIEDAVSITGSPGRVPSNRSVQLPTQFVLSVPRPSYGTMESLVASKKLEVIGDIIPDMMTTFHGQCCGDCQTVRGPNQTIHDRNSGVVFETSKKYAAEVTAGVAVVSPTVDCSQVCSSDVRCRSAGVGDYANEPLPFCDFGTLLVV